MNKDLNNKLIIEGKNIAEYLPLMAKKFPYKLGVVYPHSRDKKKRVSYTHYTFEQLEKESNKLAHGILSTGLSTGDLVILLVPPSLEFVVLSFSLMKTGIIPVMIDPGMGVKRLVSCIKDVEPKGFIGSPKAHLARILFPKYFKSVKIKITVGKKFLWRGYTLDEIIPKDKDKDKFEIINPKKDQTSAIFFTTGSTGAPKGVVYTHEIMQAQVNIVKEFFKIKDDEIDLPTFPLFVLFSTAFGITAVIPDMDPTKPAYVNPQKIVEAIQNFGVTNTFGSPALWNRVSDYCVKNNIILPSIKRILIAGAPVSTHIIERLHKVLINGDVYTPYGATEALPLTYISGKEICKETDKLTKQGKGVCVGKPLPYVEIKIIKISDDIIELNKNKSIKDLELPQGEIGEIIAKGPNVTKKYYNKEKATKMAKIIEKDGSIWHRMGDLGYFDEKGRLWVVGRKAHRVIRNGKTLFTVMIEHLFNQFPEIFRTALVGIPCKKLGQKAILVIELKNKNISKKDKNSLVKKIMEYAKEKNIPLDGVLFHNSFPVDIRHNAKIKREILSKWAEKQKIFN